VSTTQFPRVTADQLSALPDSRRLELIDGFVVLREKSDEAVWIGSQVFSLLSRHSEQQRLGWVFPAGSGFKCFINDPECVLRVDTAVVSANRMRESPVHAAFARVCPDLVVEVLSERDLAYDVDSRVNRWNAAGASEIWLLFPRWRRIMIHDRTNRLRRLDASDEIATCPGTPGFHCRVAEFFPQMTDERK
jgi:Uma2 family endonuclease